MALVRNIIIPLAAFVGAVAPAGSSAQSSSIDDDELGALAEGLTEALEEKLKEPITKAAINRDFAEAEKLASAYLTESSKPATAPTAREIDEFLVALLYEEAKQRAMSGSLDDAGPAMSALTAYKLHDPNYPAGLSELAITAFSNLIDKQVNELKRKNAKDLESVDLPALAFRVNERRYGPESEELIIYALYYGSRLVSLRKDGEARPVLAKALSLCLRHRGEANDICSTIMSRIGRSEQQMGNYAASEAMFRRAMASNEIQYGAKGKETLTATSNLASVLEDQGKIREAERIYRSILKTQLDAHGEKHSDVRKAYSELAGNLLKQDRVAEAEKLVGLAETANPMVTKADQDGQTTLLSRRMEIAKARGHYEEAANLSREIALRQAEIHGPDSLKAMIAKGNLAVQLNNIGKHKEAAELEKLVLDDSIRRSGERHPDTILSYANYGATLFKNGQLLDGLKMSEKALTLSEEVYGKNSPEVSGTYRSVSNMLRETVKKNYLPEEKSFVYSTAVEFSRAALAIDTARLGRQHREVAEGQYTLALILADGGQSSKAISLHKEALATRIKLLGTNHPEVADSEEELGTMLLASGNDLPNAHDLALKAADIRRASMLQNLNQARGKLATHDSVFAFNLVMKTAWAMKEARAGEVPRLLDEAFVAAQDRSLTVSASALLQRGARAAVTNPTLAALLRAQQAGQDTVRDAEAQLLEGLGEMRLSAPVQRREAYEKAKRELATLDARVDNEFPEFRTLVSPKGLSVSQVQSTLTAGEAILLLAPVSDGIHSFAISKNRTAWSFAPRQPSLAMLADAKMLRCMVDAVTCSETSQKKVEALSQTPAAQNGFRPYDLGRAFGIYNGLIKPVEAPFEGTKRLYVVATGSLGDLPLSLLVTSEPAKTADLADPAILANAEWLADRYAITRLPSVSGLRLPVAARTASGTFTGYGSPVLLGNDLYPDRGGGSLFRGTEQGVLADPELLRTLAPLPGTKIELNAMAKALGAGPEALHLGNAATETAVKTDESLSRASVIAFATHGLLPGEATDSGEPGLVFTPPAGDPSPTDDGILTASETAELKLDAEWVILSACNTASAEGDKGSDSLSGLARGFLYAGARALLASHWRVSDEATAALTVETLAERKRHPDFTRAQALQAAMRTVRTGERADGSALEGWQREWAHPANWAPFSHIANRDN